MLCRVSSPGTPCFGASFKTRRSGTACVELGHASEQANVGRWKRVCLAHSAQGDVLCGPLADTADGAQAFDGRMDCGVLAKDVGVGGDGFRKGLQCLLACGGHSEAESFSASQREGCWKDVGQRWMNGVGGGHRFAVQRDELTGETACGGDCDLLAEDSADRKFEALPSAGSAQAGALGDEWREQRIAGEMSVDGFDVGAEIEDAADPSDDGGQRSYFGEADSDGKALVARQMRDLDAADVAVDLDGAGVGAVLNDLHTCDGAGREEVEYGIPVIRCAVAEA